MNAKQRIDQLLVARGVFESRARAQAAIEAGLVRIDGVVAQKPSATAARDARIEAEEPYPWVSRGGVKLAHALETFGVDPRGRDCLDIGSSTGGFTHVLLARGAARVTAIDAGREQMHASLRDDPRVALFESCDARAFDPARMATTPSLAVVDVSFISLTLIVPALGRLTTPEADCVALIKPQFEVGRAHLGKKGVVTDETARQAALARVRETFAEHGWRVLATIDSPIAGGDGNREHLIHAQRGA
jgi:23S rRNA (cytidine1920-2'-O)/16S rRNA (cytidine1409-2'-O)-methyltransferase